MSERKCIVSNTGPLISLSHQGALWAVVYLVRQVANLPLKEIAAMAGMSAPRVSLIQQRVEHEPADGALRSLLEQYKVKN